MEDFDDFGNGFGDFDDSDGEFYDDGVNAEMQDDSEHADNGFDIGWEEIAMAGSLSEEIAEDEKRRRRIERKMNKDKDQNDF